MKRTTQIVKISYFLITFLFLLSCNSERKEQQNPDGLNDDKVSVSSSFRSSYDNLIDQLYAGLIKDDIELKKLDAEIQQSFSKSYDSRKELNNYDAKSKTYYADAHHNIEDIKDSVLKNKLLKMIEKSSGAYGLQQAKLQELSKEIDSNNASITDYYTFLKTIVTLPIIEKYQKENLPKVKPLEDFIMEQNKLKQKLEVYNK